MCVGGGGGGAKFYYLLNGGGGIKGDCLVEGGALNRVNTVVLSTRRFVLFQHSNLVHGVNSGSSAGKQ